MEVSLLTTSHFRYYVRTFPYYRNSVLVAICSRLESIAITQSVDEMPYPSSVDNGGLSLGTWPSLTWTLALYGHVGLRTRCRRQGPWELL